MSGPILTPLRPLRRLRPRWDRSTEASRRRRAQLPGGRGRRRGRHGGHGGTQHRSKPCDDVCWIQVDPFWMFFCGYHELVMHLDTCCTSEWKVLTDEETPHLVWL